MTTWRAEDGDDDVTLSAGDYGRAALRAVPLATLVFGGLGVLLVMRLPERIFFGQGRPLTPYITRFVCRNALRVMGLPLRRIGQPMQGEGALVANHASWLDIFSINASDQVYFVSKAEVAGWPGIGWLARATGTVFIARDPRAAAEQKRVFEERLRHRHRLVFFPEGTSTDGLRVLNFKSTLFAAFYSDGLSDQMAIQPVSVRYVAPDGEEPRFYGWWGDMSFAPHFLRTLGARRHGQVVVEYHAPHKVRDYASRKELAKATEAAVRAGVTPEKEAPRAS